MWSFKLSFHTVSEVQWYIVIVYLVSMWSLPTKRLPPQNQQSGFKQMSSVWRRSRGIIPARNYQPLCIRLHGSPTSSGKRWANWKNRHDSLQSLWHYGWRRPYESTHYFCQQDPKIQSMSRLCWLSPTPSTRKPDAWPRILKTLTHTQPDHQKHDHPIFRTTDRPNPFSRIREHKQFVHNRPNWLTSHYATSSPPPPQ